MSTIEERLLAIRASELSLLEAAPRSRVSEGAAAAAIAGAVVVSTANGAGAETHEVQPGDTLNEIAEDYGVSSRIIQLSNPRDVGNHPDLIMPGAKLYIPDEHITKRPHVEDSGQTPPQTGAIDITIQSDDTVSSLATQLGVASQELGKAMGLDDINHIKAGDRYVFTLPSVSAPEAEAPKAATPPSPKDAPKGTGDSPGAKVKKPENQKPESAPESEIKPAEITRELILSTLSDHYHEVMKLKPANALEARQKYDSQNPGRDTGPKLDGVDVAKLYLASGVWPKEEELIGALTLGRGTEGGRSPFAVNSLGAPQGPYGDFGLNQIRNDHTNGRDWKDVDPARDPDANLDPLTNIINARSVFNEAVRMNKPGFSPWVGYKPGDPDFEAHKAQAIADLAQAREDIFFESLAQGVKAEVPNIKVEPEDTPTPEITEEDKKKKAEEKANAEQKKIKEYIEYMHSVRTNMGEVAQSQVGVVESGGEDNGIPRDRYSDGRREAWCNNFYGWLRKSAGLPYPNLPGFGVLNENSIPWTVNSLNLARHENKAFTADQVRSGNFVPELGDAIYFDFDTNEFEVNHIGMVKSFNPETGEIITIEGNISDGVRELTRSIHDPSVAHFASLFVQNT